MKKIAGKTYLLKKAKNKIAGTTFLKIRFPFQSLTALPTKKRKKDLIKLVTKFFGSGSKCQIESAKSAIFKSSKL